MDDGSAWHQVARRGLYVVSDVQWTHSDIIFQAQRRYKGCVRQGNLPIFLIDIIPALVSIFPHQRTPPRQPLPSLPLPPTIPILPGLTRVSLIEKLMFKACNPLPISHKSFIGHPHQDFQVFFTNQSPYLIIAFGYTVIANTDQWRQRQTRCSDSDHWESTWIGKVLEWLHAAFSEASVDGSGEDGFGVVEGGGGDVKDLCLIHRY